MDINYKYPNVIYEAIENRLDILKQLEKNIEKLKEKPNDNTIVNKITKLLQSFTNIPNIQFKVKNASSDVYCITIYNDFLNKSLVNFVKSEQKITTSLKVSNVKISKYIDHIYIIFGAKILKECNPQECVAIILHELGHSFAHTTNLPNLCLYLNNILKRTHAKIIKFMFTPISIMLVFLVSNLSKTLSFFEHVSEYNADEYAAKYGYGDDLTRVLHKFTYKFDKKPKSRMSRIIDKIVDIFDISSSHPKNEKRICKLKKQMLNKYKEQYKPIMKELDIIYGKIDC